MSNLSDIKRRLITVKQTRQITGAMQTVSVAKMRKTAEVCNGVEAYLALITDIMRNVVCGSNESDGNMVVPTSGKDALIVLSSSKGLCGGFDNEIFSVAEKATDDNTLIIPIGQTAANRYKNAKNADLRFGNVGATDSGAAKNISDYLLKLYGDGVKSISVAYSVIKKQAVCPTVEKLLPLEISGEYKAKSELMFEPSPKAVLDALVPLYLSGRLYGAMANNIAAEQSARHQAMSAATENADALISQLSLEYNRERQTAVTGQIVEIVGATSALRKGADSEKRF
ncbi:MAG: F0F1 ATP synthase subunit gamma [Clostridiales bacterium]|nr:F0F1 ATP synthase subunit gamma [Clostridiales bacterium]